VCGDFDGLLGVFVRGVVVSSAAVLQWSDHYSSGLMIVFAFLKEGLSSSLGETSSELPFKLLFSPSSLVGASFPLLGFRLPCVPEDVDALQVVGLPFQAQSFVLEVVCFNCYVAGSHFIQSFCHSTCTRHDTKYYLREEQ
jgi:hypothetical protein